MRKVIIIAIIVVIVVGGGVFAAVALSKPASKTTDTTTTPPTSKTDTAATPTIDGTNESITITANDDSASPDTINVKQGDTINITFNVSTQGTYHGGLEFKSDDPAIDSGSIAEGDSKVVTFTATKSFKFTPFWYQSSVQKDYFVTVNVQ